MNTIRKRNAWALGLGLLGITIILAVAAARANSAEALPTLAECDYGKLPGKEDAGQPKRFVDSISLAPVAVLKTAGIDGESTFGAGLDLGVGINPFVSIHGAAYAYETDDWRSGAIDDVEVYGRANFVRFKDESFVFYGKGGGIYDVGEEIFGFGVGVGAELRFTKNVSLGADYTLFAHFDDKEKDGRLRGFLRGTF